MKTLFSTFIGLVLLLSTITAHSATYYFHNDHLGTPQVVTDESQAVVWQGDYDPFGKATETVATIEQNLRFPGQYLDRESGLHYNYFRTYDPSIGRYTQSDPVGLGGGLNVYGYAYSNPAVYTDRYGLANRRKVKLSEGFTGGIDTFNTDGQSSFEIHVYDPMGNEIGAYGPDGWFDKHGLKGRPDGVPDSVENACRSHAIDTGRRMNRIPDKGKADIKGDRWKKLLRGIPLIGPLIEITAPSPTRVPPSSDIVEYM